MKGFSANIANMIDIEPMDVDIDFDRRSIIASLLYLARAFRPMAREYPHIKVSIEAHAFGVWLNVENTKMSPTTNDMNNVQMCAVWLFAFLSQCSWANMPFAKKTKGGERFSMFCRARGVMPHFRGLSMAGVFSAQKVENSYIALLTR